MSPGSPFLSVLREEKFEVNALQAAYLEEQSPGGTYAAGRLHFLAALRTEGQQLTRALTQSFPRLGLGTGRRTGGTRLHAKRSC